MKHRIASSLKQESADTGKRQDEQVLRHVRIAHRDLTSFTYRQYDRYDERSAAGLCEHFGSAAVTEWVFFRGA